jgi:hypothetical protein
MIKFKVENNHLMFVNTECMESLNRLLHSYNNTGKILIMTREIIQGIIN